METEKKSEGVRKTCIKTWFDQVNEEKSCQRSITGSETPNSHNGHKRSFHTKCEQQWRILHNGRKV